MSLTSRKPEREGGEFEPVPAASYPARCYRVIDYGTQRVEWMGEIKHQKKVMLSWELVGTKMADGRPWTVHATYTNSLSEKANLRKVLESWRGRKFTDTELAAFDLSKLINAPCLVNVTHNTKGDKTYVNVASVMAPLKGMVLPPLVNAPVLFDIDQPDYQVLGSLSEAVQAKIRAAQEFHPEKPERHVSDEEIGQQLGDGHGPDVPADPESDSIPF